MDMSQDNVQIELTDIKVKKDGKFYPVCPFPIGFIYMSSKDVNPAQIYGKT